MLFHTLAALYFFASAKFRIFFFAESNSIVEWAWLSRRIKKCREKKPSCFTSALFLDVKKSAKSVVTVTVQLFVRGNLFADSSIMTVLPCRDERSVSIFFSGSFESSWFWKVFGKIVGGFRAKSVSRAEVIVLWVYFCLLNRGINVSALQVQEKVRIKLSFRFIGSFLSVFLAFWLFEFNWVAYLKRLYFLNTARNCNFRVWINRKESLLYRDHNGKPFSLCLWRFFVTLKKEFSSISRLQNWIYKKIKLFTRIWLWKFCRIYWWILPVIGRKISEVLN